MFATVIFFETKLHFGRQTVYLHNAQRRLGERNGYFA